ncbi:hypothetical protein [Streptomyces sp. TBY4]|uniref:hypothetical protein n=1 Tax=Streptomyces sp. TBY4 TaxID=2962030 RepID=UPI0020B7A78A|nr:hypothetical protein [Streptomyces sp. TBY4]MCP3758192.1 hypothetical protein [Streptomyces sp. TBY4]
MSASITLRCNTVWCESACTGAITTYCSSIAEARAAAGAQGWRSHPSDVDYCPGCSGTRSPGAKAAVRRLLPRPPRQRKSRP